MSNSNYAVESVAGDVEPIEIEPAYSGYSDAVCFMTLMRESDQAFADLLSDLEAREEPIVVCMFGDHQPALDTEFRNAITVQDGENEVAQKQKSQMTPYMIWTNFDTGTEQREENMSINYLGATLMDVAGYHTTYTNYLLEL